MAVSLSDLRYDHSRLFWGTISLLLLAGCSTIFALLPKNSFFEAVGVNQAQVKVSALKNATYWYSRSLIHASAEDLHFEVRFGNVVRYDAGLVASLPNGPTFEEVALQFADVVVTSPALANSIVQGVRFKDARFEIYDVDKSVVWIGGKPLNVVLIEGGAAKPDPNPPTNIVDVAFASYYWNQFKGVSL